MSDQGLSPRVTGEKEERKGNKGKDRRLEMGVLGSDDVRQAKNVKIN